MRNLLFTLSLLIYGSGCNAVPRCDAVMKGRVAGILDHFDCFVLASKRTVDISPSSRVFRFVCAQVNLYVLVIDGRDAKAIDAIRDAGYHTDMGTCSYGRNTFEIFAGVTQTLPNGSHDIIN
jgi:hypothetical protein